MTHCNNFMAQKILSMRFKNFITVTNFPHHCSKKDRTLSATATYQQLSAMEQLAEKCYCTYQFRHHFEALRNMADFMHVLCIQTNSVAEQSQTGRQTFLFSGDPRNIVFQPNSNIK